MKKLQSLLLLGFLMILAACSNDELIAPDAPTGQTITVTFNDGQSRAMADYGQGSHVNRCIMEVYHNGVLYGERQTVAVNDKTATFNLRLVASQEYQFVFWADCGNNLTDKVYDTTDLTAVKAINYTGNNDEFDAFFATRTFIVEKAFTETVELRRPFGQLNIKTLDMGEILKPELKPNKVQVKFTEIPTTFNVLTSTAGTPAEVTYTAELEDATEGEISVDYIFAAEEESNLADFEMTFLNGETAITTNADFKSIPIRRNYRTNITGNLLTKQGAFNVIVVPEFYTPDLAVAMTIDQANAALAAGKTDIIIKEAPTEASTIIIPKAFEATETVSIQLPAGTTSKTDITISEGTEGDKSIPEDVNITLSGDAVKLTIDLEGSTVTLDGKGSSYATITASTAENTLIISEGTRTGTITVNKGNVLVYGNPSGIKFGENGGVVKEYHVINNTAMVTAAGLANDRKCEKIVLEADVSYTYKYSYIQGDIDLNGHTLTYNGTESLWTPTNGSCKIHSGKITAQKLSSQVKPFVYVNTGSTLTLEDVELGTNNCGIVVMANSTTNIVNSTINTTYYALSTNAQNPFEATVNLSNSTFIGNTAILFNVPLTLTMNKCTVKGTIHGMAMRGGTANISDCDITLTYDNDDWKTKLHEFDNINWRSGNEMPACGFVMGNKGTSAYQYPTNVTLKNTKINLAGTYGAKFPAVHIHANQGDNMGVTFTYDDQCTFGGSLYYGSDNITVNGEAVSPTTTPAE